MLKNYVKKPVVIQAVQLSPNNIKQVYDLVYNTEVKLESAMAEARWDDYCSSVVTEGMIIPTLEDGNNSQVKHVASIGDYIIRGIKGEFYPCKPDIFELTYQVLVGE